MVVHVAADNEAWRSMFMWKYPDSVSMRHWDQIYTCLFMSIVKATHIKKKHFMIISDIRLVSFEKMQSPPPAAP